MADNSGNDTLVMSYLDLRKAIGILGIAYPFALSLGSILFFHTGILRSISAYHYSGLRDVFSGTLWAIGFFLLSYKGYGRVDRIAGDLGCIFAVGVTLFPTLPLEGVASSRAIVFGHLHQAFAAAFFLTLIFFSLFLFTKTDRSNPSKRKLLRNVIYKVCGYTMAGCIVLIVVYYRLTGAAAAFVQPYNPVFWLESTAIVAFGFSWLTKGEAILKDLKRP